MKKSSITKKNKEPRITEKIRFLREAINEYQQEFVEQASFDPVLKKMIKAANDILLSKDAKRIRAIIPLLVAEEIGVDIDSIKRYGVIIELLHFTSLVHDDVIDHEEERRHHTTLNMQFTNSNAILIGDHFICQSIEYALQTKHSTLVIAACMQAVKDLISGVILEQQLMTDNRGYEVYEEMAIMKTGSLFGLAFGLPFVGTDKFETAIDTGRQFGLLFQIYDDCFDRDEDKGYYNLYNIFSDDEVHRLCVRIHREIEEKCAELGISSVLSQIMEYLQTFGYFSDLDTF